MRFVFQAALVLGMSLLVGLSQVTAQPQAPVASDAEKQELAAAVQEASTSGFDMIRALEAHLRKYPNTPLRRDMLPWLAKAAVEAKDEARIIQYGEPVLAVSPNEVTPLDRISRALINAGGQENAAKALGYAKRYEDHMVRVPVPSGYDPVEHQDDHDRPLARAPLYH